MELLSKAALWDQLSKLVEEEGFTLFDLDLPGRDNGILRVYIGASAGGADVSKGIGLDECSAVCRRLKEDEYFGSLRELYALEVSSPGINRRLQRPEHFSGAIGERVKLTVHETGGKARTVVGTLTRFDGKELELDMGPSAAAVTVNMADVQKARVDFLFD